ncbi:photosystem II reaction center protein Psb28 [Chamaesiphon sp. VAR_48_metabat_135_sub]|uniref:photosystem II reaction center protein Psb28 n=1 Tax=Chamaesiphon sp. VAR_48_metabat_135_sub TaxID=2964699 RepID=UPI00286A8816|nr:photosystem II reaction center protein Psb28 [Chamaesiphon sp. VAR_48_metabat_135_sub]
MAQIQFSVGITEPVVPDVRLTKSRTGEQSTASFYFDKPAILGNDVTEEVTGMYMLDEEGEIVTREVKAKFINGKPAALEVMYIMNSTAEWDRFMRFMERYSAANGLGFQKAE